MWRDTLEVGGDGGVWVSSLKHVVVVFVKMHKPIMGATHFFFWWGIGGCYGLGELENAIHPCMSKFITVCESTD